MLISAMIAAEKATHGIGSGADGGGSAATVTPL
jgi:hypothetical protein